MSIVDLLTPRRRLKRRVGRHRLQDKPMHDGYVDRENELKLLAERGEVSLLAGDANETTMPTRPIPGLPLSNPATCPMDQCTWPDAVYITGMDHHDRLLDHIRCMHAPIDVVRTIDRKDRAITRLQERLP